MAQISSPGMTDCNTASWIAFGVRQSLDSAHIFQSFTYAGFGRKSTPATYNPFQHQGIFVLNQEFYHSIFKRWQYSLALSYRKEDQYESTSPYDLSSPAFRQEFRTYGKIIYHVNIRNVTLAAQFRQEFRAFYTPDFVQEVNRYALRSRLRIQGVWGLDEKKRHRISASAEALFSTTQSTNPTIHWTTFEFQETRFCFYYSIKPTHSAFVYSVGYMNNLLQSGQDIDYIAFDVIWEHPFKHFKAQKLKHIE